MWERLKNVLDDALDMALESVFGNEKGRIRVLCLYVVMFLACLAGMVHAAYRAMSRFPGETFWADVAFAVWFGVLAVVTYVSLLALSECLTRYKEWAWREERDHE